MNDLTLETASLIVDKALEKREAMGFVPLTVAVLDAGGQLKVLKREDGSSLLRPEIAMGKAWGALGMGFGGRELARRASRNPVFFGALSDFLGSYLHSISQNITETFPLYHLLSHSNNGLMITPGKFNPIGIRFSNQAILIALDGEGNGCAAGDSIQSVAVTEVVYHGDRICIIIKAHRPERSLGLVFRPTSACRVFIFTGPLF